MAKCNCLENVKDRIKNELPSKNPDYANLDITKVYSENEAWLFPKSGGMTTGLSIPFIAEHKPVGRKVKTTINMVAKYCPFCGEKYEDEEDNGNGKL